MTTGARVCYNAICAQGTTYLLPTHIWKAEISPYWYPPPSITHVKEVPTVPHDSAQDGCLPFERFSLKVDVDFFSSF